MRELAIHSDLLGSYIRKHLPPSLWPAFDPSDVVQDVLFEGLQRSTQYLQIEADFRQRWLLTIARNRITYLVRRHRSSKRLDQMPAAHDQDAILVAMLEEVAIYERTPSASAASHEAHSAVRQCIRRLSADHAEVLQSRFFDGLRSKEIAEKSGKTDTAVRQLIVRALSALRGELKRGWVSA